MYQNWENLLFVHWICDASEIQKRLPNGLYVDMFDDKAYVGLIPFAMKGIRLRFMPPIPWLSQCLELNCRTYVVNEYDEPGIWFFSLDISHRLHAYIGRKIFYLPYFYAQMRFASMDEKRDFSSKRLGTLHPCRMRWTVTQSHTYYANEGTLEHFLIERYRLYAFHDEQLFSLEVSHKPYPLRKAEVDVIDNSVFGLNGLHKVSEVPVHSCFSPGVEVSLYPMTRVPLR